MFPKRTPIVKIIKAGSDEVNFVVQSDEEIIPVEVKTTINLPATSLQSYRNRFAPRQSVRTSMADCQLNESPCGIPRLR